MKLLNGVQSRAVALSSFPVAAMHLVILIEEVLKMAESAEPFLPATSVVETADILFYDWLDDSHGVICGLGLHLSPEHRLMQTLSTRSYVTLDPYPQLWFSAERKGSPRGVEAFGGIHLIETDDGRWIVFVTTNDWLDETDERHLRQYATRKSQLR